MMEAPAAHDRPLRVLQLGGPMGLYGAERWILALIGHLPTGRIESIVGTIKDVPGPAPALCVEAAARGFATVVFEAPGRVSAPAVAALRRYLREQHVDVLHTHFYKSDLLGRLAVRGTACRIVSTPHGWSTNAGLKLQVYETLDRLAFYTFDAVCPLSQDLYDGLARWPGLAGRLTLINNAVDVSEVDAAVPGLPTAGEQRPAGRFVVGYIGQLIPRKCIDDLLRAFATLPAPAELWIIGDGPQRPELEALAQALALQGRVRFLGYRNDRLALLKSCDAFVLPSRLEGIPRCVLESMAAAVPVVGSDIPGTRSLVRHGETGLLFPVGDVQALAAQLRELATDLPARRRLGQAASDFVRAEYSAQRMADRYATLFESLGRRGPAARTGGA
ncbi:MAG: glycosyltransferase [Proteobacteria bacterium]|nr:glycosyltransferase [Pseudomonadota bacterium]